MDDVTIVIDTGDAGVVIAAPGGSAQGPAGPPGPQGDPGPAGPQGPAGSGGLRNEHIQTVSSDTWVFNHNLGVYPTVDVLNSAGAKVDAGVQHTSVNQVVVSVKPANTGRIICKG